MTQPKRLTEQQRKFAELLVYNEGKMSPAEAAYEAGYKTRARKAASEMRNPKYFPLVVKYIGELRAEVREKYGITFEKHVTELAQIRNEALKNKAWSAAVNAEVARGKAGGLYVDQKLVMTGNIDNLFPFFTTNSSSSLNKFFNSGKLRIFFDLEMYFTFTQSHLGFSGFDFGSKYFEFLSNCVGSTRFISITSISPTIPGGLQFE